MNSVGPFASRRRRALFVAVGAAMLGLWGWSLVPAVENWNNPHEDGFAYVPVFYATPICLPAGLVLLAGAIVGQGGWAKRAAGALLVGCAVLFIVVAFLIFQYVANSTGGS